MKTSSKYVKNNLKLTQSLTEKIDGWFDQQTLVCLLQLHEDRSISSRERKRDKEKEGTGAVVEERQVQLLQSLKSCF